MVARAPRVFLARHAVYKIRFVDQRTSHRHQFKALAEYLVYFFSGNKPSDIHKRQFQVFTENTRIVEKISLAERSFRYHHTAEHPHTVL